MSTVRRLAMHRDLVAVAIYVVACAAALFVPVPLVRALLVIPLVLFVPGYSLVSAFLPLLAVSTVERVLMAIGGSIAITILTGLAMGLVGVPLTPVSWLAALSAVSIAGIAVALLRRTHAGVAAPSFHVPPMPRLGALAVVIAILIAGNVMLASRIISSDQQADPPLQLWLVPIEGRPLAAELGVHADGDGGEYRIVISSSGSVVAEYNPILEANETWQVFVEFVPEIRTRPVVARLYEEGAATESRFVVMQPLSGG